MKAKVTCVGVALLAGCSCEPAMVSRDASVDGAVFDAPDSASLDTPRGSDAPTFDAPDAPAERLVLTMVDSTPCPSVALPP